MTRRAIRVLVVDDSALIRQMLTRALLLDPRIEVVGAARNGVEAVEQATLLAPDVMTLDIDMPELSGLEALPFIVKNTDSRVVMLSSMSDPDTTYHALELGAVDFIPKPGSGFVSSLTDLTETLLKKIRTAYRIDPAKRLAGGAIPSRTDPGTHREGGGREALWGARQRMPSGEPAKLVGMAASTGGPPALERVFGGLGADLPAAFLVVQHLPQGFTDSLVKRLAGVTDLTVRVATDRMRVLSGEAYVAPHGKHMVVSAGRNATEPRLRLEDGPPQHGVMPAADPLMRSLARAMGDRSVGVVLTGMGRDGALGLSEMRESGADTIAQDEATSVVWGMPAAACRNGAAQRVVPIDRMAAEIRRSIKGGRGSS